MRFTIQIDEPEGAEKLSPVVRASLVMMELAARSDEIALDWQTDIAQGADEVISRVYPSLDWQDQQMIALAIERARESAARLEARRAWAANEPR